MSLRSRYAGFDPSTGGGANFLSTPQTPAEPANTNIGKMDVNLIDDPVGTITSILGPVAQPVMAVAGGIGDIGFGGVGVKQALGAAGEVVSGPANWLQTQAGRARILQQQGKGLDPAAFIGQQAANLAPNLPNPFDPMSIIGAPLSLLPAPVKMPLQAATGAIGGALGLNRQDQVLPADLQQQLDAGGDAEKIANELANRNAGFSSNPVQNLMDTIIVDPMNVVSFGGGKALTGAAEAGKALRAASDFAKAGQTVEAEQTLAKLSLSQRMAGVSYNVATKGMSDASSVVTGRILGHTTSGYLRAMPKIMPTIQKAKALDPAAAAIMDRNIGIANGNMLLATVSDIAADDFGKLDTGLAAMRDQQRAIAVSNLATQHALNPKQLEGDAEALTRATLLRPTMTTPTEIANDAVAWYVKSGISEDVARQIVGKTASVAEWQVARAVGWGAAIHDLGGLRLVDATKAGLDTGRLTLLAPETLVRQQGEDYIARLGAALGIKGALSEGKTIKVIDQLSDVLGPRTESVATGAVQKADDVAREVLATHPNVQYVLQKAARDAGKTKITARDVLAFLKTHLDEMPAELEKPITGAHSLGSPLFQTFRDTWGDAGYRLGFEPKSGYISNAEGQIVRPFVSLVDDGVAVTQRNPLGRVYDGLMSGVNQRRIISEAQDRFTAKVAQYGMTDEESRSVMRAILNKASDLRTTPRAAFEQYDQIFTDVLGHQRYGELRAKGLNPIVAVNHAFEGNWQTVGLTQKLTGAIKTKGSTTGNYPVRIAEQLYPNLKFKWNPMFTAQEIIESPFFNVMRGVDPHMVVDPELTKLYAATLKNNVARSVFEAGWATQMSAFLATHEEFAASGRWGRLADAMLPGLSTKGLAGAKEQQALMQVAHELPHEFQDAVQRVSPKAWAEMEAAYGTDPATITQRFLTERLNLARDQRSLGYELAQVEKAKLPTTDSETLWQAYRYGLEKASNQAYKTHFFNPERGFLERTINHPYLGLYPISYMYGKVVPEFARFLFIHPFGMNAPLAGYDAFRHGQEAILTQMTDPDFAKFAADHAEVMYIIQLLLPATPTNIPVNAPAWARHAAQSTQPGGKKFNPATEVSSILPNVGVMRLGQTLTSAGANLGSDIAGALGGMQDQLDNAAQLYDTNVP
jgi:hypothetical protein